MSGVGVGADLKFWPLEVCFWLRLSKKSWFGSDGRDSLLLRMEQEDQGDDG
jgi:hypothetical protein